MSTSASPAHANRPTSSPTTTANGRPQKLGTGWSPWRIVAVVLGSILVLQSLGMVLVGGGAFWVDRGARDDAGYLTSQTRDLSTDAYVLSTENIAIDAAGWNVPDLLLGDVRVQATGSDDAELFIGVARTGDVERYLDGVQATTIADVNDGDEIYRQTEGDAPSTPPAQTDIWAAQTSGSGSQSLEWSLEGGDWTMVMMNADASRDIHASADIGATVPVLGWVAGGLLLTGGLFLVVGVVLIVVSIPRARTAMSTAPRTPTTRPHPDPSA